MPDHNQTSSVRNCKQPAAARWVAADHCDTVGATHNTAQLAATAHTNDAVTAPAWTAPAQVTLWPTQRAPQISPNGACCWLHTTSLRLAAAHQLTADRQSMLPPRGRDAQQHTRTSTPQSTHCLLLQLPCPADMQAPPLRPDVAGVPSAAASLAHYYKPDPTHPSMKATHWLQVSPAVVAQGLPLPLCSPALKRCPELLHLP
jgi:hypothetical protein